MKIHYINILLFDLPLNILVNTHKKSHNTYHTQTSRSLWECDLYMPNCDNDLEMKKVMENFNKQTQQRFQEYDERMKTTRQKCKEQCDKEIEKIILKDKLEKQMAQQFATLQTDIQSDAIPTCVCEKSMADKVEKGCLRCGGVLGGGVAPSVGLLGGIGIYGWKMGAPAVAMELAKQAGIEEGVKTVIAQIKGIGIFTSYLKDIECSKYITKLNYDNVSGLMKGVQAAIKSTGNTCPNSDGDLALVCETIYNKVERFSPVVQAGKEAADSTTQTVHKAALDTIESTTTTCTTAITASVIAIVVIVLIMVIIYLILRYRRKKKMKKKLQYIKLLEE
ncbi:rifin PIR protein, putative [Plasmodium reichenowi]|uniref:Rifin PIR protein, putative n=1 Tax=Plasmodium reichenowi TaxID=5854 RepID=A0A2P9D3W5_PLARE|nr:rifin PIR protein, putative [Plasmodium reichenowi]